MKKILLTTLFLASVEKVSANGIGVNVDYLYWNARQSDMIYVFKTNSISGSNSFEQQEGVYQLPEWGWGIRVGAGYVFPNCIDTYFSWTRFHNSTRSKIYKDIDIASQLIQPGNTPVFAGGPAVGGGAALSKWNLKLDQFALDCGTTFYAGNGLTLHPTLGLKGLILNQRQYINYNNFVNLTDGHFADATVDHRNNYWGIGPSVGFDGAYCLGYGLSLQGECSFAAYYGRLPSKSENRVDELGVITATYTQVNRNMLVPSMQLFLGLDWGMKFNCMTLDVSVGYELQYYWDVWRTQNTGIQTLFISDAGYDALELHGITARIAIGF